MLKGARRRPPLIADRYCSRHADAMDATLPSETRLTCSRPRPLQRRPSSTPQPKANCNDTSSPSKLDLMHGRQCHSQFLNSITVIRSLDFVRTKLQYV